MLCSESSHDRMSQSFALSVVNDLGVDLKGLGKNSAPVDEVVGAIRNQGGIAVPNYGMCTCYRCG